MYLDAEERKKNLLEQNQIADGMMFKMENDPKLLVVKLIRKQGSITGNWKLDSQTKLRRVPTVF